MKQKLLNGGYEKVVLTKCLPSWDHKKYNQHWCNKRSRSTIKSTVQKTQVTFPLLFMLTLDKKLLLMQHLYFGSNNEVIKTANKISIMTLIKGHGNCVTDLSNIINFKFQIKFYKSRIKILVIMNFIRKKHDFEICPSK